MKTLIVYASRYGFTRECVEKLVAKLEGDTKEINLDKEKAGNIEEYDNILIGGSVKIGKMQPSIKRFCEQNHAVLLTKKTGFFISCGDSENYLKYLNETIPADLLTHATTIQCFGGEFRKEKMGFLGKKLIDMVIRQTTKEGKKMPEGLYENIDHLASYFNS